MNRYFIHLCYDGTDFHGWQIQPNGSSVQETLQRCLSTLLRIPVQITGAGRTDAGVHARLMVAHFDFDGTLDGCQLVYKLNKLLPPTISVFKVEQVAPTAHARFDAVSRTYHYFLYEGKQPFLRHYAARMLYPLNFERMNEAAACLMEYTDFSCFSKSHTDVKTNNCTITEAVWEEQEEGLWRFTISANRFLRNMVRAIVGTLVEVGRGRMTVEEFRAVIEGRNRCEAGESMPGNALFLVDIKY